MALIRIPIVVSTAIAFALQASSFSPSTPYTRSASRSSSELFQLIVGDAPETGTFDQNVGGVGLAKRSAVKIVGASQKGKGSDAEKMIRYEKMQELDMAVAKSIMEKAECQLLCSGAGKELYQDPGTSDQWDGKVIALSPIEAAKSALSSMASAVTIGEDAKSVVINFLGGDDLVIGEVLEACDLLVDQLDIPAKTKVTFNSISFEEIPIDVCTVTVVASGGKAGGLEGVDESVARGELYVHDGKWFTVAEGDITTASK